MARPNRPPAADPAPRARTAVLCLALAAATLAVYWQVRRHDFITCDDVDYVTGNARVRQGLTLDGIRWAFTTRDAANWHPLTWLAHMLDVELFGMDPGAHHLVALALHLANTILLFLVLRRMTAALWPSAFVAALFALHPLHVESVAWVAERKDVLSTLFWILTLWAYTRYAARPSLRRYALVALLLALGLMAKPMLVTLPFVLLLLDCWPLRRLGLASTRKPPDPAGPDAAPAPPLPPAPAAKSPLGLLAEKLPLFVLAAASSAATFLAQRAGGAMTISDLVPLPDRLANAVVACAAYLWKTAWPARLAFFYPYRTDLPARQVVLAAALLAVLTGLAVWGARRRPYLAVGWFWFLGTLVPVIGIVQVGSQSMADRYTYVPLVGVFIIVAWGAADLTARWRRRTVPLALAAAVVLAACAAASWKQVAVWKDTVTLCEHALRATGGSALAHFNLGIALAARRDAPNAAGHYHEALRLKPDYAEVHLNLGNLLHRQGQPRDAVDHYAAALRLNPRLPEAHNGLAAVLDELGRTDDALRHYREALRLRPAYVSARFNLAGALARAGRPDEAADAYRQVIRLQPDDAEAHYNLATVLASLGRTDEAAAHWRSALALAEAAGRRDLAELARARIHELQAPRRPPHD